jgi:hypothetical protein
VELSSASAGRVANAVIRDAMVPARSAAFRKRINIMLGLAKFDLQWRV